MNSTTKYSLKEQFLLDPSVVYLNHGSFGATPQPVFDCYQNWQRELEKQPTEFLGRRANGLLAESRKALAQYLGTTGEKLAYVVNATYGINVVARSLSLSSGDEVLATDHEYGAMDYTWQFLSQRHGFKYINQPISLPVTDPQTFVDQLWAGVTPRTKVIFLSHITSPTALVFPVKEVCQRARAQGIMTVVDGAHAPGQIPLALDELGADFYTGNLHKWLCAPKGAGILYARAEVMEMIDPLVVSWGFHSDPPGQSRLVDYVEMQGTRDIAAFLSVPEAIKFQQANHWDQVWNECHERVIDTVQRIADLSGMQPISPLTTEWIGQMASAPLPSSVNVSELHTRLYDKYRIEIPVLEWHGRNFIRCSIQAYNTQEDADALVQALKESL
jgi:isopenicillin-N epimerase